MASRLPVRRRLVLLLTVAGAAPAAVPAQCATPWLAFGLGTDGRVSALATLPNGELVAGGDFTLAGGTSNPFLARWNGLAWAPVGAGLNGPVQALAVLPGGDLVAGGSFTAAGGAPASRIARWNGSTWAPLGLGLNGSVTALAALPDGGLVAAGSFTTAGGTSAANVARWDGSSWSPLGAGLPSSLLRCLQVLPGGDVVAGGFLAVAGVLGPVRWNGTTWTPLGQGMTGGGFTSVLAMTTLPNGDLIAGGTFTTAGGASALNVARWDGSAWSPLGAGVSAPVYALATLPDGDLVAGGLFVAAGGAPANRVARWDGSSWSALGAGTDGTVYALLAQADGFAAGGDFTLADGVPAHRIARRTTTCPAAAVAYGTGCSGAAGPTALVATQLPWLGGTCRATATGLPPDALAVGVFAFGQLALPLPAVHPLGTPGCMLLVTDEILLQFPPANGSVATALPIPPALPLVGATFYHQVMPVERDGAGNLVALTSTNGLALTIGLL